MNVPHYLVNLLEWDLPRLENLEWRLVERLAESVRVRRLGAESLEDVIRDILHDSIIELVESAANETLEYWLKGLGDGHNGRWPELCVELPYLEHDESSEPLTMVYSVDNGEGTRIELNRTTLEAVMSRFFDGSDLSARWSSRAKMVVFALRRLADKLDAARLRVDPATD